MPPVLALGRTNGAMRADTAHAHRTPLSPVRSRRCGVAALRRCGDCRVAPVVPLDRASPRAIAGRLSRPHVGRATSLTVRSRTRTA
ncbi:hypothetical protein WT60_25800 [Burkholderia sp. MSMB617WGS]|nr:hypothetical protein WT60_25800 [Burkholderia sp. MSMB617WGS]